MATKETLKARTARAREEMRETGRLVLRAPALVHMAECAIHFLLGTMLSGAEIFGGYAPFGLAMVGAAGSGLDGFSALLGACLGYLTFQGFTDGLRYAAAAILIFSVSFAFYDVKLCRKPWFMPLCAAALDAVTGFVTLSKAGWLTTEAIFFLTELLLTAGGVYFYRIALTPWHGKREDAPLSTRQLISLLILCGTVVITLSGITVLKSLSLGRIIAALAVMAAAFQWGVGSGASVGVLFGLAMDLSSGLPPFYSMAFGLSGVLTGVMRRQGRLFAAVTYVLADAVAVLWTWNDGLRISLLYEVFVASVIFLLLPQSLLRKLGALAVVEGRQDTSSQASRYLKKRLEQVSSAFQTLHSSLRSAFTGQSPGDADASAIFDRTADKVCRRCVLQNTCWQKDYVATFNALNDALPPMLERGKTVAEDFPPYFSSRCLHFPQFLSAVNEELSALLYRRQYRARLEENRASVCRQYGSLAEILGEAAAEFSVELTPDPVRERRVRQHLAALGLEGEVAAFYDEGGHLRLELEGPSLDPLATEEELRKLSSLIGLPLRQTERDERARRDRLVFTQAEPLMAVAGVAARNKAGQTVSGDTGAWFKLDDGSLYVLLCDGMGSGPAAGEDSSLAVRLLEQFLRAGVGPDTALRTLNGALALRGESVAGFTTIDLLQVDLFTGEAAVYKYGAAPTYLRHGGKVRRISGSALPAGLALGEGAPDKSAFPLQAGDCVLLVSDGVTGSGEDIWLKDLLAAFSGDSPKDLACALIAESERRDTGVDDRTALVLRLTERK